MTRVAVLGTGRMGGAMARRLEASGFELTLWNRTRSKAERLNVGRVADTPVDAARDADIVISSLTGPSAVRDVHLGPNGVFREAAGKTVIEMSTAGPEIVDELDREAQLKGVRLVEAPVVGSVPAVEKGTLLVLIGGRREDLDVVQPVLSHLGEVHYAGPMGSGSRLKLVANSMLGIISAGAAELIAAGKAAGLEGEEVFWILSRFAPALRLREAGFLRDQHEPTMFAVRDLAKDLGLALDLYARAQAAAPVTSVTRDLFRETERQFADLDISAIVRRYANQHVERPVPVAQSVTKGGRP